ncbi:hypothetical protein VNI00_000762 [Paramarasmius palmivorus]|uniref:Cryptic loci regulator 2 N-terminal domain-containing protein n=1 Tax=Paramarasmius palmivorus TaxID=297713 RepID=A0AAW0EC20_9AGAR
MVRTVASKHELPPNPTYKEFERSDGDSSTWPVYTERIVDSNGHVNYMQYLDLEQAASKKWRSTVGQAVAKALKWPEGHHYVLKDWPANYRMYDHHKGPADNPRHDIYLFGPKTLPKFRSPPEFIPHAIWLFTDPTMNNANCECKYCSKKTQREVTHDLGTHGILPMPVRASGSPSVSSPAVSRRIPRPRTETQPIVHASVQKAPKPPERASNVVPKFHMKNERDSDLRAVHQRTSLKIKRWCREDEIVWCALQPPIKGPQGDYDTIYFWPAIVQDYDLKIETHPKETPHTGGYDPKMPPWGTSHSTMYKVRLLAVSCVWNVPDDQVIPYQAYHPPKPLLDAMRATLGTHPIDHNTTDFSPFPNTSTSGTPSPPPTFAQAVGAFAMSIQIAAELSQYWALTDSWSFQYNVPLPSSSSTSISAGRSRPMSLQEAISEASTSNAAALNNSRSSSTKQAVDNMLGIPNPLTTDIPTATVTQNRFQGLWWGAERIWTGDFVRIKLPRKALAPHGAPHIKPPSGAGEATLQEFREKFGLDKVEHLLGAGSRGVVMRLDTLMLVDVPVTDESGKMRTRKECRACGPLYEIACEDWEEPTHSEMNGMNGSGPGPSTKKQSSTPMTSMFGSPDPNLLGSPSSSQGDTTTPPTMSQPSPLKPPALPNPDPAVPIEATSTNVLRQQGVDVPSRPASSLSQSRSLPRAPPNDQLSQPVASAAYNMPPAPDGYKFRSDSRRGLRSSVLVGHA